MTLTAAAWLAAAPLAAAATRTQPPDVAYRWRNVEIVAGGFVPGILFHPAEKGLIYCRTDIGGAYRMDNTTGRWTPLTDIFTPDEWNLLGIDGIGLDPTDPQKLYLVCGAYTQPWASLAALLISNDQGRSWAHKVPLPFQMGGNQDGRSMGERLVVDPDDSKRLLLGTRKDGLWESLDGGLSWAQVPGFPYKGATPKDGGVGFVTFAGAGPAYFDVNGIPTGPTVSGLVYAGVADPDQGLYVSIDRGRTWMLEPDRPKGLIPHHGFLASDKATMYFTFANAPGPNGMTKGAVWKLETKSGRWTDITPEGGKDVDFGYAGLALDSQDPQTLMVASMDRWEKGDEIWRSTDGGRHWRAFGPGARRDLSASPYLYWGRPRSQKPGNGNWVGSLVMDPFDRDRLLYGTGATIMECLNARRLDQGKPTDWHVKGMGVEETAVLDLESPPSGAHLVSALGDIGGFTHDDLAVSPSKGMTLPVYTTVTSLDYAGRKPSVMARVSRGHFKTEAVEAGYSVDGGKNWRDFPSAPLKGKHAGEVAVGALGGSFLWAPESSPAFTSLDLGRTWSACQGLPLGAKPVADRVNAAAFYGLVGGVLYASRDQGLHFEKISEGLEEGALEALPGREGDLWLASKKGLFHSTDGGRSFERVPGADEGDALGFGMAAPGAAYPALYLAGQVRGRKGLYRSLDGGTWWQSIQSAQQQWGWVGKRVTGDLRLFGRVYVATNGRGILWGDPDE